MAPTAADVADSGLSRTALWMGTVTVVIVAVGVLTLALVPAQRGDVTTASVTTVAVITDPALITPRLTIAAPEPQATRSAALTPLRPTPRNIASVSTPSDAPHTAVDIPDADDPVIVLTDQMIYRMAWRALAGIDLPDGAIVIDLTGGLLGHVDDGAIVAAHPDLAHDD